MQDPTPAPGDCCAGAPHHGIDLSKSRLIAGDVYLAPSLDGSQLCLVEITSTHLASGCNPADDFFKGRAAVYQVVSDGGPGELTSLAISGVTRPGVSLVRLVFGTDVERTVPVTSDGGFSYKADAAVLAAGFPSEITVFDASGNVVESDAIGPNR